MYKFSKHRKPILPTLMMSELPDKYVYCEYEKKKNIVFLPNSESFWIKFDLCLKISSMQRKNREVLKMVLSGKANI